MGTIAKYLKNLEMREERVSIEVSNEIYRNWIKVEFFRVTLSIGRFLGIFQKRCVS